MASHQRGLRLVTPTYFSMVLVIDKHQTRPELCDALPWFRSVQGGVYHSGGFCWGFLVDADCGIRSYIGEEVIITRV